MLHCIEIKQSKLEGMLFHVTMLITDRHLVLRNLH